MIPGGDLPLPRSTAILWPRLPVPGPKPWAVVMLAHTSHARASFAGSLTTSASVVIIVMGLVVGFVAVCHGCCEDLRGRIQRAGLLVDK